MKKRFWLLSFLAVCFAKDLGAVEKATPSRGSADAGATSLTLRILARVGDASVSARELLIEWLLQNPKSYVPGRRDYYSAETEQQILQEYIVQVLVEEENRIVGTQTLSSQLLDREMMALRRNFGSRWKTFLDDFELSETEVKTRLGRLLLVRQTLETRLRDALQGARDMSDASATKKAEESLQGWLQQLRSRYKVQFFRYEKPSSTSSP